MKIKGKKISDYCGNTYEFTMEDGTRKYITVSRNKGMKEARQQLEIKRRIYNHKTEPGRIAGHIVKN